MEGFGKKLEQAFYLEDTVAVAKNLLGNILVHETEKGILAAEITETEAYTGVGDRACHSYGGRRTPRTEVMYLPGGHAYIYLIYGMYYLFNVVTEGEGNPCAVLIRGVKPVMGLDAIAQNRHAKDYDELTPAQRRGLLNGPGKVCVGLGLTKEQNGLDLTGEKLYLTRPVEPSSFEIGVGKRINIDYAGEDADLPYRFFQK